MAGEAPARKLGLITILADDYSLRISSKLLKKKEDKFIDNFFFYYEGKQIILPKKFLPSKEFLKIHNDVFLQ